MKPHYVYFFQDAALRVKIGRSADPRRRLRSLRGQSDHPPLTIIGVMASDDAHKEEAAIHLACAEQRVEGEWFNADVLPKLEQYRCRFVDELPETDVLVQIWTSPELYEAVVAQAKSEGRTVANWLRRALGKIAGVQE